MHAKRMELSKRTRRLVKGKTPDTRKEVSSYKSLLLVEQDERIKLRCRENKKKEGRED